MSLSMQNFDRPAPRMYRRFANATVLFFIPMATGLVQGVNMSSESRNYWMLGIAAVPFLIKGIGMILGNGEVYADISQIKDSEIAQVVEVKDVEKVDISKFPPTTSVPGKPEDK